MPLALALGWAKKNMMFFFVYPQMVPYVSLGTLFTVTRVDIYLQSQIGSIFKSKANESYCLYDSGPMVRHYALRDRVQRSMSKKKRQFIAKGGGGV